MTRYISYKDCSYKKCLLCERLRYSVCVKVMSKGFKQILKYLITVRTMPESYIVEVAYWIPLKERRKRKYFYFIIKAIYNFMPLLLSLARLLIIYNFLSQLQGATIFARAFLKKRPPKGRENYGVRR